MFGIIKKMCFVLLINKVNASNHTKYVSLSDQKCEIQLTLISVHPNQYSQELFGVKLDKCIKSQILVSYN